MNQELFFEYPQIAWALFVAFLIALAEWALFCYRGRKLAAYTSKRLLPQLLVPRSFAITLVKGLGWVLIWALGTLALSSPYGNIHYASSSKASDQLKTISPANISFLVDVSASMGTKDGYQGQARLDSAKAIVEELLLELNGRTVSLFGFTSELIQVVPTTLDLLFAHLSLQELHLNEGSRGGTAFAPVLRALSENVSDASSSRKQIVIMLSDGGDNHLESMEKSSNQPLEAISSSALPLKERGVTLLSIGLGSLKKSVIPNVTTKEGKQVTSMLEEKPLQIIAQELNGNYYRAEKWPALQLKEALLSDIEKIEQKASLEEEKGGKSNPATALHTLYYQIPLGFALFFYLLNLLLPDTAFSMRKFPFVACLLLFCTSLHANTASDPSEDLAHLAIEAEAWIQSRQPQQALWLYEKALQNFELKAWQKERVKVNQATAYLEAQNLVQALEQFNAVLLFDLSLPRFGSFFKLNQAVAYWLYAQTPSKEEPLSFPARYFFLKTALQSLQESAQLECLLSAPTSDCLHSHRLISWKIEAERSLFSLLQEERKKWLQEALPQPLVFLLLLQMQASLDFFSSLSSSESASFFSSFLLEMKTLNSFWESIQKKLSQSEKKEGFELSYNSYQKALTVHSAEEAKNAFQKSVKFLEEILKPPLEPVDSIDTLLDWLLLQERLSPLQGLFGIKKVLEIIDSKKAQKNGEAMALVATYLSQSLSFAEEGQLGECLFFILAAKSALPRKAQEKQKSVASVLQEGIKAAEEILDLFFLKLPNSDSWPPETKTIFNRATENIQQAVHPFLQTLLEAQLLEIEKNQSDEKKCLTANWKEIIFFYNEGLKKIEWVSHQLKEALELQPQIDAFIATLSAAIQDWKAALKAFKNPQEEKPPQIQQSITEAIEELQEMYLEDQFPLEPLAPSETSEELHTW